MSSIFDKGHAERFAQLLGETESGSRPPSHSRAGVQLAQLANLGEQLGRVKVAGPTPEFRSALRARLMAAAEREGIGRGAVQRADDSLFTKPRRSRTRVAIIAGIAGGTLAVSGISMASGDANPGDPLYSVKRSTEKAQLALASSDLSRGQLYLEFARTRVTEARAVSRDGRGFDGAMVDMDANTVAGIRLLTTAAMSHKDPAALDVVDRFVDDQRRLVNQLTALVDGASRQRVGTSLALLDAVSARAQALRAALACGAGTTATVDSFGPQAAACRAPATARPETTTPQADTGSAVGGVLNDLLGR